MSLLNKEKFLEEVVSHVNFKYDRYDIKRELESHILDKMEQYVEQGLDRDKAEELSVNDMGDAKEIGKELNRQHNPIIGWLWLISNVLLILSVIISIFYTGFGVVTSLFTTNPAKGIDKSNIVYKLDIDEKIKVDDTVIHFTDIVYEKNGDLNIIYKYYDTRLWGTGWSFEAMGEISDNFGNTYFNGHSQSSGGIITRSRRTIENFPKDAETLIITYDSYNRFYKVEIPLQGGDKND